MNSTETTPVLIEKEQIESLHFPKEEVLLDVVQQKQRLMDIERAQALGNLEKGKISVVFQDNEGLKRVETTIWAGGQEMIVLKKGVFIPVHRIHKIKFL